MRKNLFLFFVACVAFASCTPDKKWSVQFADSEMKRFPQAWQLDHGKRYVWGYAQGVGCLAMLKVWKYTGDSKYYRYVYAWADTMVRSDGAILSYKISSYNIDYINAGKILFDVYDKAALPKYRMAMDTLLRQLDGHPQTSDSVFWHKKIYPHQIWLDGIYMAGPYLAQYGQRYNRPDLVDKALHEVLVTYKRTLDPKTGLLYHAYDESREQRWANKQTGQSPNFWGRAIGWYLMAAVDILDFVPEQHPMRKEAVGIINKVVGAMAKYQDASGLWYQVIDQGEREGNYLEASVSSMLMYSCAKAVNKGYLPKKYRQVAEKAFDGITAKLIRKSEDGTLSLTQCCSVGGLGGNPYRDGSFEYYISEKIRDNDSKATAPFIMGCIELNR
jgi:unsaturated rhamnogalacturonyl hydrolase